MKKNHIIFTIGGIILLLAATASLAALDYYVKAQGITQVSAPKFYIGSVPEETLLINEEAGDCAHFGIDGEYRTFKTKLLGGTDFSYSLKGQFSVRAKVSSVTSQDLILSFGYYDTFDADEKSPHYLCSATVTVGNELNNYTTGFENCGMPTNVKRLFYEFQKGCPSCDYTISKCAGGFYTKIELSK